MIAKLAKSLAISLSLLTAFSASTAAVSAQVLLKETIEHNEQSSPLRLWEPSEKPHAVAVLLHGISASAHSLNQLGCALARTGVLTYGMDLRGHGWWHTVRDGAPGRKCDYIASVQDVERVLIGVKHQYPDLPLFLVGESVGAAVALRAATESSKVLEGVVLCAPGYKTAHAKPTWLFGDALKACLLRKIDVSRYQRRYGSEDKIAIEETCRQPGIRTKFSAAELLGTALFIAKNPRFAQRIDPNVSVLVLQGSNDLTLRPRSAFRLFAKLPSIDKKFVEVPNCGHVLIATTRLKPLVRDSILSFIEQRSIASTGENEFVAAKPAHATNNGI
jgi:alpha-beta hydrolase superfamily lysophospholipase